MKVISTPRPTAVGPKWGQTFGLPRRAVVEPRQGGGDRVELVVIQIRVDVRRDGNCWRVPSSSAGGGMSAPARRASEAYVWCKSCTLILGRSISMMAPRHLVERFQFSSPSSTSAADV